MHLSKFKLLFFLLLLFLCIAFVFQKKVQAISLDECQNKNVNDLSAGDRDWCLNVGFPQIINSLAPAQQKNKNDFFYYFLRPISLSLSSRYSPAVASA